MYFTERRQQAVNPGRLAPCGGRARARRRTFCAIRVESGPSSEIKGMRMIWSTCVIGPNNPLLMSEPRAR